MKYVIVDRPNAPEIDRILFSFQLVVKAVSFVVPVIQALELCDGRESDEEVSTLLMVNGICSEIIGPNGHPSDWRLRMVAWT
jgi:hypothetical protein